MKYGSIAAGLVLAIAAGAGPLDAQRVSFEGRGALTFPTGDFGDAVDGDAGFGADVMYNVNRKVSLYGGYQYEQFDDGAEGVSSSGFEGGVKLLLDRESGVLPWVRLGATLNKLDIDGGPESDRALGFQGSIGVDIPLGEVLSFSPALRYQAWSADFDAAGGIFQIEQPVRTLALDFGLHVHPHG